MIIKIEGLPEGQKIKHINVEVTFDDGNVRVSPSVETIPEPPKPPVPPATRILNPDMSNEEITKREQKEIPPEMLDMEF